MIFFKMKKNWRAKLNNFFDLKNRDFSRISPKFLKKILTITGVIFALIILFICFEVYVPINPNSHETITYTVQKGWGDEEIAKDLEKLGVIRSSFFFRLYAVSSLQHSELQAGKYNLSPKMSIYDVAKKFALGDSIKDKIVILEGWTIKDIGEYFEEKGACTQNHFIALTEKDYSDSFDFLADKPKNVGLEGYLFPDTYEISEGETCEDMLSLMLDNFGEKLTPELRTEITNQKKSIFDIVTMASLLEKEARTMSDKKIISGILWKRLSIDMPLQLDATINYITNRSDPSVAIKHTKIDSPYNTYMYKGLPKGPISNPGIDSITAALYPTTTKYWYYLSNGKTFYSETFQQHTAAKAKYLD